MNKIRINKKCISLLLLSCMLAIVPCPAVFSQAANAPDSVSPKSDVIGWKYKKVNGKRYKRLYNYTTKTWIGNWILVG